MHCLSRQIAKLQDQAVGLTQRIRALVSENARTQMTEDEFKSEYGKLAAQYGKLSDRIVAIQGEKDDKEYRAKRISLFIRMLAEQEECLEFDPVLFTAFVERVVVSGTKKDVVLRFVMRDGSDYEVTCSTARMEVCALAKAQQFLHRYRQETGRANGLR